MAADVGRAKGKKKTMSKTMMYAQAILMTAYAMGVDIQKGPGLMYLLRVRRLGRMQER